MFQYWCENFKSFIVQKKAWILSLTHVYVAVERTLSYAWPASQLVQNSPVWTSAYILAQQGGNSWSHWVSVTMTNIRPGSYMQITQSRMKDHVKDHWIYDISQVV